MDELEFKELFRQLEEQGWNPQLCDTPIPYYDTPVMCGEPNGVGDIVNGMMMFPKDFLSMNPEFFIDVKDDSMKDANIREGDTVRVQANATLNDGDIVVVKIDDDYTLKSYFQDEMGNPWLVPQNSEYEAFPLKQGYNVWLVGKVTKVMRDAPRVSFQGCQKYVSKARAKHDVQKVTSPQQISQAIREVAPMIDTKRKWYAVYRAMVDANIVKEQDYDTFVEMVSAEVPSHDALPTRAELQRIALNSFTKPVPLWRSDNAPVQGKRYNEYLNIAKKTAELLSK